MLIGFYITTALVLLLALLPILRIEFWPIRALDFPRLQIACFAAALLIAEALLLPLTQWSTQILLTGGAVALAIELWWIIPYTRLAPVEVNASLETDDAPRISIVTANVLTPNRQAERLLAQIREHQPDIFVTLESDSWWESQLDSLRDDYPHSVKCPLDNLYGMHVYSRLPLSDTHTEFLVEDDKPSVHTLVQLPSGEKLRCHFLHPAPPSPTENDESSERDAELLVVARNLRGNTEPVIVTGDLNDVAWSRTTRTFRKISGLLDPRIGRGMFNTFHANFWFLRWPLDHVFHSEHFRLARMFRLEPFGSDHFALYTELTFNPAHQSQGTSPEAEQEDLQLAREKTRDEAVKPDDVPEPGN
ncbi:endonuclease/exonuclease/phosphatase family protein [Gilvimarinus xylanilyticus]|uniref:Endonuclease/exonuclease/phosphatase family protein n=1 Tax=Gilvimarinus xylanilyticus TaxID=2944139 RepID=A0A9X2HZV5_9GAMM|nr:endonuclease/exonuclease/phosphatase family protein [Gilvimarinus xylanilyticus]MCP8899566.1 endonuclease/exonuclease/phosphatase family protein [Gilvimarinus xylanilyticus]